MLILWLTLLPPTFVWRNVLNKAFYLLRWPTGFL